VSLVPLCDLRRGVFCDTAALAYEGRRRIGDLGAIAAPAPIMTPWPSSHASHVAPRAICGTVLLEPNIHRAPFDGEAFVRSAAQRPRAFCVTVTLVRLMSPSPKCASSRSDISDVGVTLFLGRLRLINCQ